MMIRATSKCEGLKQLKNFSGQTSQRTHSHSEISTMIAKMRTEELFKESQSFNALLSQNNWVLFLTSLTTILQAMRARMTIREMTISPNSETWDFQIWIISTQMLKDLLYKLRLTTKTLKRIRTMTSRISVKSWVTPVSTCLITRSSNFSTFLMQMPMEQSIRVTLWMVVKTIVGTAMVLVETNKMSYRVSSTLTKTS